MRSVEGVAASSPPLEDPPSLPPQREKGTVVAHQVAVRQHYVHAAFERAHYEQLEGGGGGEGGGEEAGGRMAQRGVAQKSGGAGAIV